MIIKEANSFLYYSLLLVVASLPFHFLVSSYAIIIALLLFIFEIFKFPEFRKKITASIKKNKIAGLLLAFFLYNALSFVIHIKDYENLSVGLTSLEQKLSFIIFPLLLSVIPTYEKKQIKNFFFAFIGSVALSTFIALCSAIVYTYLSNSFYYFDESTGVVFNNFMYHRLGSFVGMHAVYFAEYVLLAFIIYVSYSYNNFPLWSVKNKLTAILFGIYLISIILLLKSAAILLILLAIITLFTFYYLYKSKERINTKSKIGIAIIGIALISILGDTAISKIGSKADFFTYDLSQPGGGEWNGINLRLAKWHVANMAIADHWILGVGPGNTGSTLDKYYEKVSFNYALQLHYNPHNQILHTFLSAGILGIMLLILIFIMSFSQSIKKKDSVMFLFLISFFLFSMSESTLAVNKGIVFFTLLLSFFSYLPEKSSYYLHEK